MASFVQLLLVFFVLVIHLYRSSIIACINKYAFYQDMNRLALLIFSVKPFILH